MYSDLDSVMNEYILGLSQNKDDGFTYKVLTNSQIPRLKNFNDIVSRNLKINLSEQGSFNRILYILKYKDYIYFLKFDISNLDSNIDVLSEIIRSIRTS